MELRQLEYFIAVCEELHFTRAAERIGISQPNLSLSIKALEEEVGLPLFNRIGKRIEVTDAGDILKRNAKMMFQNLRNGLQEIEDLSEQIGGSLSVGALPSELDYRLTPMFIRFFQRYPNIRLKIYSELNIAEHVLSTDIDIGISAKPALDSRLVVRPLVRDEYGIVVSKENELSQAESVSLLDLQTLPIVMYPKGLWGRDFLESWCVRHGVQMNVIVETSSNPSLFQFVKAKIGVGIVASALLEAIDSLDLAFIPIRDYPPVRETSIIYRADKYLNHASQAFIHFVEEYVREHRV